MSDTGEGAPAAAPLLEIVDPACGHVRFAGADARLKPLAMKLLLYLLEHRGQIASYDAIARDVWEYIPQREQIHQHKAEIVKVAEPHLGRLQAEKLAKTVRGHGLRMELPAGSVRFSHRAATR